MQILLGLLVITCNHSGGCRSGIMSYNYRVKEKNTAYH